MPCPRPQNCRAARLFGTLVAICALLVTSAGAAAAAGTPAATGTDRHPVVLISPTGLRWDDLGTLTTPALWSLSREGSVGNNVVRSVRSFTCPAGGWLAVSSGGRAEDLPAEDGTCRTLRDPLAGGPVPGWDDYLAASDASSYDSRLGLLGDTVRDAGVTATGIGPGAAIALADSDGAVVGTHLRRPADAGDLATAVAGALAESDLLVVDAGTVRDPGHMTRDRTPAESETPGAELPVDGETAPALTGPDVVTEPTRGQQVQAVDDRVGAVLAGIRHAGVDATVLVVSLSDSGRRPQLQLAVATGPNADGSGTYGESLLGSSSTRQDGYLQTTDVTPTLLSALGIRDSAPRGALSGSILTTSDGPTQAGARVRDLVDDNRHAQATRPLIGPFYILWVVLNLFLYGLVTVGLNLRARTWWTGVLDRWWPRHAPRAVPSTASSPEHAGALRDAAAQPERWLRGLQIGAVAVAAIPVSTFLANAVPWWRAHPASYALTAVVVGWVAVITALALLPRWRRWLLGPLSTVATITAVVLATDVITGAHLALDSLMGPQALVAGRFYGFGNPAFALFAAATILLAFALTNPLLARGRRALTVGLVLGIGVVATAINGLPGVGADFGGPPALVPGFAVMALLAAGVRLTWRRILLVLLAGAVTVTSFAVADWMRPPDSRSHLGRFVETVLDGGIGTVVWRKLQQNLAILFGSEQTLLALGGVLLVVVLLGRPMRSVVGAPDGGPYAWLSSGAPLRRLATDAPMLLPGLTGLAVTLGIGFAVNDSGVVIPATGIALAVPLLVTACAGWLLEVRRSAGVDPLLSEAVPDDAGR